MIPRGRCGATRSSCFWPKGKFFLVVAEVACCDPHVSLSARPCTMDQAVPEAGAMGLSRLFFIQRTGRLRASFSQKDGQVDRRGHDDRRDIRRSVCHLCNPWMTDLRAMPSGQKQSSYRRALDGERSGETNLQITRYALSLVIWRMGRPHIFFPPSSVTVHKRFAGIKKKPRTGASGASRVPFGGWNQSSGEGNPPPLQRYHRVPSPFCELFITRLVGLIVGGGAHQISATLA